MTISSHPNRFRLSDLGPSPLLRKCVTLLLPALFMSILALVSPGSALAQAVTRERFTPTVVPETQTDPVRFEATISGNPAAVVFTYNGVDRLMFDNGTNGDLVAGDGVWTVLFTPAGNLNKNTTERGFPPV